MRLERVFCSQVASTPRWTTHNVAIRKGGGRGADSPARRAASTDNSPAGGDAEDAQWELFRHRLANTQRTWASARDQDVQRDLRRLEEEEAVARSHETVHEDDDADDPLVERVQRAIRSAESKRLRREEARTLLALEVKHGHVAPPPVDPFADAPPPPPPPPNRDVSKASRVGATPDDCGPGADATPARRFLAAPRRLGLVERNSERAVDLRVVGAAASVDDRAPRTPALVWTEPDGTVAGFCCLSDVESVARGRDAAVVRVLLKRRTPRAVRFSGGLRSLCFRAGSASECLKVHAALSALVEDAGTARGAPE